MVGLLAAAQGRRRTDPIEDLVGLRMAARADQPGRIIRDFQTAHERLGKSMPLTTRYYLADAVFTAYVEAPAAVVEGLAEAIQRPTYPLYLGRRSCPPSAPILLDIVEAPIADTISATRWLADDYHRRAYRGAIVTLDVQADADVYPDRLVRRQLQDSPLSFDPTRRDYGMRSVVDTQVSIPHPEVASPQAAHDPMGV